jgi:hypothetical protein
MLATIDAFHYDEGVLLRETAKETGRRGLKMMKGKKGKKKHPKELDDDELLSDDSNATAAPSMSLAPSTLEKSSKKMKDKKKKKDDKSVKSKKKKSKKEQESLSPSPSPANATTVAPLEPPALAPITIQPPFTPLVPTKNSGNGTTITSSPTFPSKKKKSKKGGKSKGMDAATGLFQSSGGQLSKSPRPTITSAPLASNTSPTIMARSKTPPILPSGMGPNQPHVFMNESIASQTPSIANPENGTNSHSDETSATPSPSSSHSPSPSPNPLTEAESVSASPAPTALSETVDATPFQLAYNVASTEKVPTEQINEAVDATFTHINDFLIDSFDVNSPIQYDSLIGSRIAHSSDYGVIQYIAAVRFILVDSNVTTYLPATGIIDDLIETAFSQASVSILVDTLQKLPSSNPYSQTKEVTYKSIEIQTPSIALDVPPPTNNGRKIATKVGVSGAVLVICIFTGIVALYRQRLYNKLRSKRKKTKRNKSSKSGEKKSTVPSKKTAHNIGQRDSVEEEDEDGSISDCTSSVRSGPQATGCNASTTDNDDSYRHRILEEDTEIKFLYPTIDNMNSDHSIDDPLFPSSPLISKSDDKMRHDF